MSKTITVYTLEELETVNPVAFERVHKKWKDSIDYLPWSDEIMASLKAVIEACGATLKNWSIGAYSPSHVRVEIYDSEDETSLVSMNAGRFVSEILEPNGYTKDGKAYFPGICKWTGYCGDDDLIEAVYKALVRGNSLKDALEGLASVAQRFMEDDLEQHEEVESMLANWGRREYTLDGKPV